MSVAGSIIGSGATGLSIYANTADGADNKIIGIGGGGAGSAARGAFAVFRGNEHATRGGELGLHAGGSNGAIYMAPRAYFGTRPENNHRWTLALDQYNTLYGFGTGMNILHNLYYDGSWRYRYGEGSNSGGVVVGLVFDGFSVRVANNGTVDQVATLTDAIYTNLNGNTAFGKNSFVGGNRLEVEGNTLVNGTMTVNDTIRIGSALGQQVKLYDGWYLEGSYLCTLSGFTSLVTCTTYYVKCGKAVTLTFSTAGGTSNDYDIRISTGKMPASIRPARQMHWVLSRWSFEGLQTTTGPDIRYTIPNNRFRIAYFQSEGLKSINNSFSISYLTY